MKYAWPLALSPGAAFKLLADRSVALAPAEFILAAACCRWPRDDARVHAIREAARLPIDWLRFLRVLGRHRVWSLAEDGLRQAGVSLPAEAASQLGALARRISRQNLAMARESLRLQRLFDGAGIRMAFIKGVSLSILAYGNLALKHGRDIDLVISPADIESSTAVLKDAGYALCEPAPTLDHAQRALLIRYFKHFAFRHLETGSEVELHWRLHYNSVLFTGIDVLSFPQKVDFGDTSFIRTLNRDHLCIYLSVHGAAHSWSRLKWLADFAALLGGQSDGEIARLYCLAQAAGAARCFGQALLLRERLLGVRVPSTLSQELRSRRSVDMLEALALNAMLRGNEAIGLLRSLVGNLLLGDSLRYLCHEVRRDCFSETDISTWSLPAALSFLYPTIRVPSLLWRRARYPRHAHSSGGPASTVAGLVSIED
jgi:hypothetical protein